LDVAVSPNALKNQLNLETETEEKNSPVLLQLLNTLNVQDINLEDYIINEVNVFFFQYKFYIYIYKLYFNKIIKYFK